MRGTPFPNRPSDVVTLAVSEFTCELDGNGAVSIEMACRHFLYDANRALVWLIRHRALTAWCERGDVAAWLNADPSHAQDAREVAAGFALNDAWEFDVEAFRSAVEEFRR